MLWLRLCLGLILLIFYFKILLAFDSEKGKFSLRRKLRVFFSINKKKTQNLFILTRRIHIGLVELATDAVKVRTELKGAMHNFVRIILSIFF